VRNTIDDRQVWNASDCHKGRRTRDQIANDEKSGSAHTREICCPPVTPRISCVRATFIANPGV